MRRPKVLTTLWRFRRRQNCGWGLDAERSWVVLTEANDFIWPGPDLRPAVNGDPSSVAYGMLPPGFMRVLRERLLKRWRDKLMIATKRTE